MPAPFDLGQLVAGIERQRHRPIQVRPFSFGPGGPCGLRLGTADADYIYHQAGTTPFHPTHIAMHEIAHMLPGHQHPAAWQQFVKLLAPDVDQALIKLILGAAPMPAQKNETRRPGAALILSSTTRYRNQSA